MRHTDAVWFLNEFSVFESIEFQTTKYICLFFCSNKQNVATKLSIQNKNSSKRRESRCRLRSFSLEKSKSERIKWHDKSLAEISPSCKSEWNLREEEKHCQIHN